MFDSGYSASGLYPVWINEQFRSIFLHCDMTTRNSVTGKIGWSVIQRRMNGKINFERGWDDYVRGFGSLDGEYWIGLQNIYHLTLQLKKKIEETYYVKSPQMRIDLEDWDGIKAFVEHKQFVLLSKDRNYAISINYPMYGTAVLGGRSTPLSRIAFSTFDADHDRSIANVALEYRSGWWFTLFPKSSLNGPYPQRGEVMSVSNIRWRYWSTINPNNTALRLTSMKLQEGFDFTLKYSK